jgi:hypothetical protein
MLAKELLERLEAIKKRNPQALELPVTFIRYVRGGSEEFEIDYAGSNGEAILLTNAANDHQFGSGY